MHREIFFRPTSKLVLQVIYLPSRNFLVESAVSLVGEGASNPYTEGGSDAEMPHRSKITATMREYKYRKGKNSEVLRQKVQDALHGVYPGVAISVEKDRKSVV